MVAPVPEISDGAALSLGAWSDLGNHGQRARRRRDRTKLDEHLECYARKCEFSG